MNIGLPGLGLNPLSKIPVIDFDFNTPDYSFDVSIQPNIPFSNPFASFGSNPNPKSILSFFGLTKGSKNDFGSIFGLSQPPKEDFGSIFYDDSYDDVPDEVGKFSITNLIHPYSYHCILEKKDSGNICQNIKDASFVLNEY